MEKIVDNEKKYLLCSELTDGMVAERYAYLVRITRKLDVNKNPFLTFFFRTKDQVTLIGHKFRVEENADTGINLLTLNKMIVLVKFEVQVYNGSFSLLVKELVTKPQEDTGVFFESFTRAGEVFDKLNQISASVGGTMLDFGIRNASLFSIQYGISGGYVELLDIIQQILIARKTPHTDKLLKCLFSVANSYFLYLRLVEKIEFLPKKEILSLLQKVYIEDSEDLTSVAIDTLSALMGQGKPEHLYAHILVNAFNFALNQMRLEDLVKTSPRDLVIKLEEGKLIYY